MTKSYSATMIGRSAMNRDQMMTTSGSFNNISIDGRLSIDNAIQVARETFKKEKGEYLGFVIEKTSRFVEYKSPLIIDNNTKAEDILFLL